MKLNKFIWDNFIESRSGREWADFFSRLRTMYEERDSELEKFIGGYSGLRGHTDSVFSLHADEVMDTLLQIEELIEEATIPKSIKSRKAADSLYREIGDVVEEGTDEGIFAVDDVPSLSIALHILFPEYFFPYYFFPNFGMLAQIFDEFGIFMPPVPKKSDYDARYYYYLELSKSLYDFWDQLGLDRLQLPIFLYGFAPKVISRHEFSEEMPKAKRAWFIGGGVSNGDYNFLEAASENTFTMWTGHPETEVGDILVMYCLAPKSIVHSIWRAVRPGAVEPFRGYYGTIWMSHMTKVSPITFADLISDPILREMPLVKQRLQGINGRQIQKRFFDRIIEILVSKGQKIENLPRLEEYGQTSLKVSNERDVELNILEPLLSRIGYIEADWMRQVSVRVGRNEKVIPDYLIDVSIDASSKRVTASWVWEAKYSVATNDQLKRDFSQVSSYGRLVNAKGVGLISREGVWLSTRQTDYSVEKAQHWSLNQICLNDELNQIRAVAGAKTAKGK